MISKRLITLALVLGTSALIAGCSKGDGDKKTDDTTMDHSKMDHSDMDNSTMDNSTMDNKAGDKAAGKEANAKARSVAIAVDTSGFNPGTINAKAGEDLELVFTRTTDKTCGTEVVIASTGKTYDLPLDKPVMVAFHADKAGTVGFACGMDMLKGSIVVE